jgi:hypothetical protein
MRRHPENSSDFIDLELARFQKLRLFGEMAMGVYLSPSSSTAILLLLELPPKVDCQLCRMRSGSLMVPGCSRTPLGAAPLAKNFAPYSSAAIAKPTAFFAIAIGE